MKPPLLPLDSFQANVVRSPLRFGCHSGWLRVLNQPVKLSRPTMSLAVLEEALCGLRAIGLFSGCFGFPRVWISALGSNPQVTRSSSVEAFCTGHASEETGTRKLRRYYWASGSFGSPAYYKENYWCVVVISARF